MYFIVSTSTLHDNRNPHITDSGVSYLAMMSKLTRLNIRWCPRITDVGLKSIIAVKSLRFLSLAGLHQITARSLLYLVEADQLEEIELTNCPAASSDLQLFLSKQMPKCNIVIWLDQNHLKSLMHRFYQLVSIYLNIKKCSRKRI